MSGTVGAHNELHSEQGALPGEHPGRSRNPVIKVADIAWLEFEKPDLDRAEAFARAFGFTTALRTPDELQLRGTDAGAPCVLIRRGPRSRFVGTAFRAARRSRRPAAGRRHRRTTPSHCRNRSAACRSTSPTRAAFPVRVVAGMHNLPELPGQDATRLQLRPRTPPRQRHAAPAPRCRQACSGSVTSCCRPPNTSRH